MKSAYLNMKSLEERDNELEVEGWMTNWGKCRIRLCLGKRLYLPPHSTIPKNIKSFSQQSQALEGSHEDSWWQPWPAQEIVKGIIRERRETE